MKEEMFYVITFNSTHHAIKGEKTLMDKGIDVRTIPTPREITASCGLSIKFFEDDINKIKSFLEDSELDIDGIYRINQKVKGKEAIKLEV